MFSDQALHITSPVQQTVPIARRSPSVYRFLKHIDMIYAAPYRTNKRVAIKIYSKMCSRMKPINFKKQISEDANRRSTDRENLRHFYNGNVFPYPFSFLKPESFQQHTSYSLEPSNCKLLFGFCFLLTHRK